MPPEKQNLTHHQLHMQAWLTLGAVYGGLTCQNINGIPIWTLYYWNNGGSSSVTGEDPAVLIQQVCDTLTPHAGDTLKMDSKDPAELYEVIEALYRAVLAMIPINGQPTTWLPEHGWLLPEGMANVLRGDDCSEDGENFTLDPQQAMVAWWAFFAGKRSELERLKGTIQLMERSQKRLARKNEELSAAAVAVVAEKAQWQPWETKTPDWSEITSNCMVGRFCVAHARISAYQGSFSGSYSSALQRGTVYPGEHPTLVKNRLDTSLGALSFPPLPPLPGRAEPAEPTEPT